MNLKRDILGLGQEERSLGKLGGTGTSLLVTGIEAVLNNAGGATGGELRSIDLLCNRLGADDLSSPFDSFSSKKLLLASCSAGFFGGRLKGDFAVEVMSFWSLLISSPEDPRGANSNEPIELIFVEGSFFIFNAVDNGFMLSMALCGRVSRSARGASVILNLSKYKID